MTSVLMLTIGFLYNYISEENMKIEIVTTKKKISKAIINQMRSPTELAMVEGDVLGYMIRVKKDSLKSILIKYANEYFIIDSSWIKGETAVYRKVGKWSKKRELHTPGKCQSWWEAYQRVLR